jgi:hypothetical protein
MAAKTSPTATLLIGVLIAGPALCAGGWLTHPCESDGTSTHAPHHSDRDGEGCGHEEDCASDPCSLSTLPPTPPVTEHQTASGNSLVAAAHLPPMADDPAAMSGSLSRSAPRACPHIPFPPSDTPLRI